MGNNCIYCNAPIHWMQGENGKSKPVNLDGSAHRCQNAAQANGTQTDANITKPAPVVPVAGMMQPPIPGPETVIRTISDRPDYIMIGDPLHGGEIKVYYSAEDPAEGERLVMAAFKIRDLAQRLHDQTSVTLPDPKPLSQRMSA
jgi:hypothetical protein